MDDDRTEKCLRQVEHMRGHLWHIYYITVNQVMVATVKLVTSTLPIGTLRSVASLLQQRSIKEILIGTTSSGIWYQLRDIYSIYRCCWNVATYKWKVHNGKIEIVSFVVKFVLNRSSLSISRCMSRYEAD